MERPDTDCTKNVMHTGLEQYSSQFQMQNLNNIRTFLYSIKLNLKLYALNVERICLVPLINFRFPMSRKKKTSTIKYS